MRPRAVLFDLDGTLHDSDPVWLAALRALAERHELIPVEGAFAGLHGLSTPDAVAVVHGRLGVTRGDVAGDVRWLEERVAADLAVRPAWHRGALDLVRGVRATGVPVALVTSSSRLLVDSLLTGPVATLFDTVVSGDDVVHVKPDPEPYLLAAAQLRVDPAACVAVEDSPVGTASAAAAGCHVVDISRLPDRLALNLGLLRL